MSPRKRTEGVALPPYVPEPDYPGGDGPAWVSQAFGSPGCLSGVTRHLSDDGEVTALVLHFANGTDQLFRPARLVTTRRLAETLGALGFPIPYYQPPQLAALGQALGRIADSATDGSQESSGEEMLSVVANWAVQCLRAAEMTVLVGRSGADVRGAIEYVRHNTHGTMSALIGEPSRGVLLGWTVPIRTAIRDALGTAGDRDIGFHLRRGGLVRERLAARPGPGGGTTLEMPVWALYNGWQGVTVDFPLHSGDGGQDGGASLETVRTSYTCVPKAHTHIISNERSTTDGVEPNSRERSTTAAVTRSFKDIWAAAGGRS